MYRSGSFDDSHGNIFEPETLLPTQHADLVGHERTDRPEVRLVLAVVEDALAILHRGALEPGVRESRDYAETREWVESGDAWGPFSFENACEVLGYEAEILRRALRAWHEHGLTADRSGWRHPRRRQNGSRHSINLPRRRGSARAA